MKKLFFIVLTFILVLCGCGAEEPAIEEQQSKEENSISESSTPETEVKTEPDMDIAEDFEKAALALAKVICGNELSPKMEFSFDPENADYLDFIIILAAEKYPYEGIFPMDENGKYHFSDKNIAKVVYEVFGVEGYKCSVPEGFDFVYNEEKSEYISGLEFGFGGGLSAEDAVVSISGDSIAVDFILTDSKFFKDLPGWVKYGEFRMIFCIMENENGKFLRYESVECINLFEPLDIAEHIVALNEVFRESLFTNVDYKYSEIYKRFFKDEQINGTAADAIPDLMLSSEELENGFPEGYFYDAGEADCYLVYDYFEKEGICGALSQWLREDIYMETVDRNLIEFNGALYLIRGGRGYGAESCSGFEIVEQTETEIKAVGNYFLHDEPVGKIELIFSVDNGKIILEKYKIT